MKTIKLSKKGSHLYSMAITLPIGERMEFARLLGATAQEAVDPHADITDQQLREMLRERANSVADGTAETISWQEVKLRRKAFLDEIKPD